MPATDELVAYEDLPNLLLLAAVDARHRKRALQLVEADVGFFKIVSGMKPWTTNIRAYITAAGVIMESTYAVHHGFNLPKLDPRITVVRSA